MPIRSATSRAGSALFAIFLGLALVLPGPLRADQTVLSLGQAREVAVRALHAGDTHLAIQIASGLLHANPKDPMAHYILALAYADLSKPARARKHASRAYRLSEPGPDRFRTAELAARMAFAEERLSLTQLWLRRTTKKKMRCPKLIFKTGLLNRRPHPLHNSLNSFLI